MDWIQTTIYTTDEAFDLVSAALEQADIFQVELIEGKKQVEKFLQDNSKMWDYCDLPMEQHENPAIRFYIEKDHTDKLQKVKDIVQKLDINRQEYLPIELGTLNIHEQDIKDEDWANNWKQFFKPFNVGNNITICPTWEKITTDRKVIFIDPGSVFGTGLHQTTQLCLEAIESTNLAEKTVFDIGSGSGILSICASKFGAKQIYAVDVEFSAPKTILENAKINNCDNIIAFCDDVLNAKTFPQLPNAKFDIIICNIVADVLISLSSKINKFLKPGGVCILSGIIEDRLDEVLQAFKKAGLEQIEVNHKDDWYSIKGIYA